jgi:hypothetical protein
MWQNLLNFDMFSIQAVLSGCTTAHIPLIPLILSVLQNVDVTKRAGLTACTN